MESISVACECGKKFQTKPEYAGRRGKCPACGRVLIVPKPAPAEEVWELDDAPAPAVAAEVSPPRLDLDVQDYYAAPKAPTADSRSNGLAATAMVLGLVSFCLPLLASIPAVVLGVLGMRQIQRSGGRMKGQGPALTGIALGGAATIVGVVALAVYLTVRPEIHALMERGQGPPPPAQGGVAPPNAPAAPPAPGFPEPTPPPGVPGFPPPPAVVPAGWSLFSTSVVGTPNDLNRARGRQ